jgi:hypothetical protein
MMYTKTWLLFVLFIPNDGLNLNIDQGLGLLVRGSRLQITKNSEHRRIATFIPAILDVNKVKASMKIIKDGTKEIFKTPAFSGTTSSMRTAKKLAKEIAGNVNELEKSAELLAKLAGNEQDIAEQYDCIVAYPPINATNFDLISLDFESLAGYLDSTKTAFTEKSTELKTTLDTLYLILDSISDNRKELEIRVTTALSLESSVIPPNLLNDIAKVNCIDSAKLDNYYLNYCMRTKSGLFCELDITIFKGMESFTHCPTVNYNGVQLVASDLNQLFAINSAGHLGLLDCGELNLTPMNPDDNVAKNEIFCDFDTYNNPCTTAITDNDETKILKSCNFTRTQPELVTRVEDGILIMSESDNLVIKEITKERQTVLTLPAKTPVLIRTKNDISITSEEMELIFATNKSAGDRLVKYTKFSPEFLKAMKLSAIKRDLINDLDFNDYTIISLAGVIIFLFPTTCALCWAACKRTDCYEKCKKLKKQTKTARNIIRNTAKENQKFLNRNKNSER